MWRVIDETPTVVRVRIPLPTENAMRRNTSHPARYSPRLNGVAVVGGCQMSVVLQFEHGRDRGCSDTPVMMVSGSLDTREQCETAGLGGTVPCRRTSRVGFPESDWSGYLLSGRAGQTESWLDRSHRFSVSLIQRYRSFRVKIMRAWVSIGVAALCDWSCRGIATRVRAV